MVQRRRELGLGAEATQEPGVVGQGGVQDLDRDLAAQADVVGDVDATRSPGSDRGKEAITAGQDATNQVGDAAQCHPSHGSGTTATDRGISILRR